MPYITKEQIKEKRQALKKAFPKYKISVTREHGMKINVAIMEAPMDLLLERAEHEQVNVFFIKETYKEHPKIRDILLKIYEIMDDSNRTVVIDGDYGAVPAFYTSLSIGKWDVPFKIVTKKLAQLI